MNEIEERLYRQLDRIEASLVRIDAEMNSRQKRLSSVETSVHYIRWAFYGLISILGFLLTKLFKLGGI